jgi:protein gp37
MAHSFNPIGLKVTWNPTTGCDMISAGANICYSEVLARPFTGQMGYWTNVKMDLN